MRLRDFQATLGRAICEPLRPELQLRELESKGSKQLAALLSSAGLVFTRSVQRSWCEGRVGLLASRTLAALPPERRDPLISAWVDRGGGRHAFGTEEAVTFLQFVSGDLQDDPAALHWCRIEQAIYRASLRRQTCVPTEWPSDGLMLIGRASCATLVTYPGANHSSEPSLFFAPGLPHLVREATSVECDLWKKLTRAMPVGAFSSVPQVAALKTMLSAGILADVSPNLSSTKL